MIFSFSLKSKVKKLLGLNRCGRQRRKRMVIKIPVQMGGENDQYARIPVAIEKRRGR